MVRNPGLIPKLETFRAGEIGRKRAMITSVLDGCWKSCISPDPISGEPFVAHAIIANPPSFAHIHCAQALGVPLHMMFTMPWSSTREFPHPLANVSSGSMKGGKEGKGKGKGKVSLLDKRVQNFLSFGIVEWMTWQGYVLFWMDMGKTENLKMPGANQYCRLGDIINRFRRRLDLEPVPNTEGPLLAEALKIPFTYCFSPALVPRPSDWDSHIDVCGFFFREQPNYTPEPDLVEFLKAGPPPIYIGFGSIVIDNPDATTAKLIQAVSAAGVRAIISRGWSKLGAGLDNSDDIYFIGDCPHEWLFQQVSAVVHHGGAGTTACGLLYGKPTTIVPFFGE
jgi:hypothetical protein